MSACTRYRWKSIFVNCHGKIYEYELHDGKFVNKLLRPRQHPRKAAELAKAVEQGTISRHNIARKPQSVVLPDSNIIARAVAPVQPAIEATTLDFLGDLSELNAMDISDVAPNVLVVQHSEPNLLFDSKMPCGYLQSEAGTTSDLLVLCAPASMAELNLC